MGLQERKERQSRPRTLGPEPSRGHRGSATTHTLFIQVGSVYQHLRSDGETETESSITPYGAFAGMSLFSTRIFFTHGYLPFLLLYLDWPVSVVTETFGSKHPLPGDCAYGAPLN